MVFSVYGHEFYSLAKYLQSVEKLDTFTDRNIGIYRTLCSSSNGVFILSALNREPCLVNKSGSFHG